MKNKKGNVAMIGIIIVIVAITAGVIGWMFAKKTQAPAIQPATTQPASVTQTQPATQSTTPTSNNSSTQTSVNQNYLAIKEWGVQFEKPTGLDDLQYVISGDNTGGTAAFTTQQLLNLDKSTGGKYCVADQNPIGSLIRVENLDTYKKEGHFIPTNVQIGNYFYFFVGSQATCSENKQVQALESAQITALSSIILKNLQATLIK